MPSLRSSWSAIDTKPATPSPSNFAVSVTLNGTGQLFRATSSGIDTIVVNADLTLGALTNLAAQMSSTGVSVAAMGTTVVRANDGGIETFTFSAGTLTKNGSANGRLSARGTGVDSAGTRAVRVTSTGIEVYNISPQNLPSSAGSNNTGHSSATAPDVKIFAGRTRAVRATDIGIEIYNITSSNVPLIASAVGGSSTSGAAIAVNATGTMAVRAYSGGIETTPSQPLLPRRPQPSPTAPSALQVWVCASKEPMHFAQRTASLRHTTYRLPAPSGQATPLRQRRHPPVRAWRVARAQTAKSTALARAFCESLC